MRRNTYLGRLRKPTALAAGLLTLALTAGPSAAFAGGKPGRGHGFGHWKHVAPPVHHHHVHRTFVVPRVIAPTVVTYRPYYWGRVFYPAGGYYLTVYSFPVYTPGGLVYYPYAYGPGGELFGRGYFAASGPRFSFAIGF